jgi:alkyldihydroxyacetonephosphate synthase
VGAGREYRRDACQTLAMSTDSAKEAASADMLWWGWGTAERHEPLSGNTRALLTRMLGIDQQPKRPGRPPAPPPSRLTDDVLKQLTTIVGSTSVATDPVSRIAHCRGKSTTDLLRIRRGDAIDAPDAVVFPESHEQVLAVLQACQHHHVAVVPFGGGTSVVGGLTPEASGFAGVIALDLRRMDHLVAVDKISMTAACEPGTRGPRIEALLAAHGLTLGHFPQSFEHASLGGFAATRSSGQASTGYGRFDQMVLAVRLATPVGTWEVGRSPANAAGPDLRQVILGSEGAFGVITELTVAVREAPSARRYEGWHVPNFATGTELLRMLARFDALPTVARLSDEAETLIGLADATLTGEQSDGCHLLLGFEGDQDQVAARSQLVSGHLDGTAAIQRNAEFGEAWLAHRYQAPYLRDALLDIGGFVETVETATWWANVPTLYAAVRTAAVQTLTAMATPPIVLCHMSHLYRTGASLYFTVLCKQADDPVAQWIRAKRDITDAIVAAGGSITHHHAVGTAHRPWLHAEIGDLGVRVLAAIKHELDPNGILNPGVLLEAGR